MDATFQSVAGQVGDNQGLLKKFEEESSKLQAASLDPDDVQILEEPKKEEWTMEQAMDAFQSVILEGKLHVKETLLKMVPMPKGLKMNLIYRASLHTFDAESFHRNCNDNGPTLLIAYSEDKRIFGGYTDIPWKKPEHNWNRVSGNRNSFVFTVDSKKKVHRLNCLKEDGEVYHYADHIAAFGDGHFLMIGSHGHGSAWTLPSSSSYELPKNIEDPATFIAGADSFELLEVEVFNFIEKSLTVEDLIKKELNSRTYEPLELLKQLQ